MRFTQSVKGGAFGAAVLPALPSALPQRSSHNLAHSDVATPNAAVEVPIAKAPDGCTAPSASGVFGRSARQPVPLSIATHVPPNAMRPAFVEEPVTNAARVGGGRPVGCGCQSPVPGTVPLAGSTEAFRITVPAVLGGSATAQRIDPAAAPLRSTMTGPRATGSLWAPERARPTALARLGLRPSWWGP